MRIWCAVLACTLLVATPAAAQFDSGQIAGFVRDSTNAALPGATATARNERNGDQRVTVANGNLDFKVNYNPGARASIFARYSISPSDIFDPPSLGAAGGDALAGGQPGRTPGLIQSTAVGATYTISDHVLVDANFGFTRQRLGAENVDIDTNHGLQTPGIPGTNGPDRLQGG